MGLVREQARPSNVRGVRVSGKYIIRGDVEGYDNQPTNNKQRTCVDLPSLLNAPFIYLHEMVAGACVIRKKHSKGREAILVLVFPGYPYSANIVPLHQLQFSSAGSGSRRNSAAADGADGVCWPG